MPSQTDEKPKAIILVVEDHLETRTFLDLALADNYVVECAPDATTALEKALQVDYDLFLIDIALRDTIDGIELADRLRDRSQYAQTPLIAMTAHQLRADRAEYIEYGFDEFLAKPFLPEELLEMIRDLLADNNRRNSQTPPPMS